MTETTKHLDTTSLKALAHPLRFQLLGRLRVHGPATASQLARAVGESSGATSYHLRQLHRHGFITEDAERGNGRDRWWRAAHDSTSWEVGEFLHDPAATEAFAVLQRELLRTHVQRLERWFTAQPTVDGAWIEASTNSDWLLRLTPRRLAALRDELQATIERARQHPDPDGQPVVVLLHAFPDAGL